MTLLLCLRGASYDRFPDHGTTAVLARSYSGGRGICEIHGEPGTGQVGALVAAASALSKEADTLPQDTAELTVTISPRHHAAKSRQEKLALNATRTDQGSYMVFENPRIYMIMRSSKCRTCRYSESIGDPASCISIGPVDFVSKVIPRRSSSVGITGSPIGC